MGFALDGRTSPGEPVHLAWRTGAPRLENRCTSPGEPMHHAWRTDAPRQENACPSPATYTTLTGPPKSPNHRKIHRTNTAAYTTPITARVTRPRRPFIMAR